MFTVLALTFATLAAFAAAALTTLAFWGCVRLVEWLS
jgi:hypothetical protein